MGGACSKVVPNPLPVEDVQRTCEEVLTTFTPTYLKKYGALTVKYELEAAAKTKKSKPVWQLMSKPSKEDKEDLKKGTLKMSTNADPSKFKQQYFILRGGARDYACEYWDSSSEPKDNSKGGKVVNLYDVWVRDMYSDERKECKVDHGFALIPGYDRLPTFYITLDDNKELREWKDEFRYCSSHAPTPLNKDKVLRKAFCAAYTKTRWYFPGWCGPWAERGGTEAQHLGFMIVDKCEKDFMADVYAKLPGGFLHDIARKNVVAMLDATIGAAVAAAWTAMEKSMEQVRPKVKEIVKNSMADVGAKYGEMLDSLTTQAASVLSAGLSKIAEPVLKPVADLMTEPVCNMFNALLELWVTGMKKDLSPKGAKELGRWASYWFQMSDVWKPLDELIDGKGLKALDAALHGFNRYKIEDHFQDATTKLLKNAAYTFTKKQEQNGGDSASALTQTTADFEADCIAAAQYGCVKLLKTIVWTPFKEEVWPELKKLTDPLDDTLPDAIKDVLDPQGILEKVLKNAIMKSVDDTVVPILEPSFKDIKAKLSK